METFIIIFIGAIILIVAVKFASIRISSEDKRRAEVLRKAKEKYELSLAKLKANPTNSDFRQMALETGREYSNLTRYNKGVTIFDEVALMNDINAASAGATVTSQTRVVESTSSIEDRLAKLSNLKFKGLIDEQEYNSRRQKILDEV